MRLSCRRLTAVQKEYLLYPVQRRSACAVVYTVQREAAEYYVNREPSTEDVGSVLYGEDF